MKAPKLTFYGITCTKDEIQTLRMAASFSNLDVGWLGNLAASKERRRECVDKSLMPKLKCRVGTCVGSGLTKQQCEEVKSLAEKKLFAWDDKKRAYFWTALGVQYFARVIRDNPYMRFYKSWRHVERTRKRVKAAERRRFSQGMLEVTPGTHPHLD